MDSDSDSEADLENCWRFLNIHPIKILHIVVSLHHNTICFVRIYMGQSLWVVSILLQRKNEKFYERIFRKMCEVKDMVDES